jgi:hypothetical protein
MLSFTKKLISAAVLAVTASTAMAATGPSYTFKHTAAGIKAPSGTSSTVPSAPVAPPPAPGIAIVTATYFNPNTHDYNGNLTVKLGQACNGKTSCTFNPYTVLGSDPYPGIFKGIRVDYTCSGVAKTYAKEGYRYEAGSETHTISCP